MKNQIIPLLLFISILIFNSCKTSKLVNPAPQQKLNILLANYTYHPQELIKKLNIKSRLRYKAIENGNDFLEEEIKYDKNGNILEIIEYYERSGSGMTYSFRYDDSNRKIARYMIPHGDTFYERDTFIYDDESGYLSTLKTYSKEGKETYIKTYEYMDNLLDDVYIERDYGDIEYEYFYDKRNRIIRLESNFISNPEYNYIEYFTYDKNNNLVSFKKTTTDGTFKLSHAIKYDKNNLRKEYYVSSEEGKNTQIYKRKYDKNLLLIQNEFFTGIKNNDINTAEYDKKLYKYTYFE